MIFPIRWLWDQLDGPQARGIADAIFNYYKDLLDQKLDFFNNWNVDIATEQQLDTIGALLNIGRPVVVERAQPYVLFSDGVVPNPHQYGFASTTGDPPGGGMFSDVTNPDIMLQTSLSSALYRVLLKTVGTSGGELGSLVALDDILDVFSEYDAADAARFYTITFHDDSTTDYMPGDITIDLDNSDRWRNGLGVYAAIESLARMSYAPVPRIYPTIVVN